MFFPAGKYMLLCKGADSALMEKITTGEGRQTANEHLTDYAKVRVGCWFIQQNLWPLLGYCKVVLVNVY